jgi:DNA-binding transcriptional LysR family regulator
MRTLNIATLDLNLLLVFDAIEREDSIVRAASRLGMSQPAASHALGDDLFIRTAHGMRPTVHARRLAEYARRALMELELGLRATLFDPASSARTFSIAVDNYSAVVLTGPLLGAIRRAAPQVRVTFRPSGTMDVEQMMDNGELDLILGEPGQQRNRFATETLFPDDFVVVHRARPDVANDPLTIEVFASQPHLHLSSTRDHTAFVDRTLKEHGLTRPIEHSVPLLACEAVLAHCDALLVMRRAMAKTFSARGTVLVYDLPFSSPAVTTCMRWDRRLDSEPAHAWLRDTLRMAAISIRPFDADSMSRRRDEQERKERQVPHSSSA